MVVFRAFTPLVQFHDLIENLEAADSDSSLWDGALWWLMVCWESCWWGVLVADGFLGLSN